MREAREARASAGTLFPDTVEVEVTVVPGLCIKLLEANLDWQERLIEQATEAAEDSVDVDPYGMALWPAAQVLAQAVAAYGPSCPTVLELGAGCGLASLTAAALGCRVTATDFRSEPLRLLSESARRQGLRVDTMLFDIRDLDTPLPPCSLLIGSDIVYERSTAVALAYRICEARRQGAAVVIADIGRPHSKAMLEVLRKERPEEEAAFLKIGLAKQRDKDIQIGLLELPKGPATKAIVDFPPSVLIRPLDHDKVL